MLYKFKYCITLSHRFIPELTLFQNQTHTLEVSPPSRNSNLKMDDLSSSEEDLVNGRMRNYENKITSLMSEVGTLKNEV